MRRIIQLSLPLLVSVSISVNAQKIDYNNIDYTYLEQIIKAGIDSLRQEKGLPGLKNDSILYLAAKDHVKYLLQTDNTGHYQPGNPTKETPHQRIQFYGGDYLSTAENVAKSFLFVPVKLNVNSHESNVVSDYKEAALEFVIGWRNSKGHYKNIINPEYNITGVAVTYNSTTQAIYAVQTFGKTDSFLHEQKTEKLIYKTDSTKKPQYIKPKPHKKHAWNIKSGEKIKDRNRYNQFKRRYLSNLKLFINNDSLSISFAPFNSCRTLFKDKKDGLALEFIPLNDYTNDSIYYSKPSRRNDACIFNGIVPKPIYKSDIDQLISKQRKERKSKNLVVNFGKIPDHLSNGPLEMNLIILKNNRIIDIIQFRYISGGFLFYPIHADTIPYTFNIRDVDIKFKPDYDTLIYKVHFERDETTADYFCVRVFMNQINKKAYKPIYGILTSYASIEGPVDHNKVLYQQRANNLIDVIQEEITDSFPLFVHTKENWNLFKKQVQNTKYEFLSDTSDEFVKKFLSLDQPLIDLDNQLKQQRYVNLYLISEEIITEEKQIKYALERYISTFNGINKISQKSPYYTIKKTDKNKLSDLQHFIFNKIVEGKIEMNALDTLPTMFKINKTKDQKKGFWQLEIDRINFELVYNKSLTINEKYNLLRKLAYVNDSDPLIAINYFIMSIDDKYRKELISPDYTDNHFLKYYKKTLDKVDKTDTISFMSDLRLFYHISKLNEKYVENPMSNFSNSKSSIKYIYNYFSDTTISEDFRFQASKFLNLFRAYRYSFSILNDLYKEGTTNKEIIRSYMILKYANCSITEDFELLFSLSGVFTPEEWCKLFTDDNRINFQILDYEIIRDFYCKQCGCRD